MSVFHARFRLLLVAMLLLSSLLLSCGEPEPTDTVPPVPTETATPTTFTSPIGEPTATPEIIQPQPGSSPSPTGTPDPARTPVAIVQAEIEPGREVITIQNVSAETQDIGGWILFNLEAEPVFRFPETLLLEPGESVQVYSAVSKDQVPDDAYFWTTEKIWTSFPADVLLLNRATRLMYWYVAYGE